MMGTAMRHVTVHHQGTERIFGKDWDADKGIQLIKELWRAA